MVKLTPDMIEGFAAAFLSPRFDNPQPTPPFHRKAWELYCGESELASVAAPRAHAKSTGLTHVFGLAVLLFRVQSYAVIVSATEDLAIDHLGDMAKELRENEDLREEFGIVSLPVDAKTEVIAKFDDGHEIRIIAKGSGQKMRGLKWNGKRPGLILGDDLEEDEQVENADRRRKFRRWVFRALLPARRKGGIVRLHGTILHEDSLLARLQKDATWKTLLFKAHKAFDDFSNILWPEQFPIASLKAIRQGYINQGDAPGYSQEYLNDPLDNSDAYLQRDWFLPFREGDEDLPLVMAAAADFAISKSDSANRTSLTAGGKALDNTLYIKGQLVGRWDSLEIVEALFDFDSRWHPDIFWVEDGQIWKALWPIIRAEMQVRGHWINFVPRTPIKDKASRGRSLQKRMRAGGVRFDTLADWFPGYQEELLRFTGISEAALDDQFDSTALLSLGFESLPQIDDDDFLEDEEAFVQRYFSAQSEAPGRNSVTGY